MNNSVFSKAMEIFEKHHEISEPNHHTTQWVLEKITSN